MIVFLLGVVGCKTAEDKNIVKRDLGKMLSPMIETPMRDSLSLTRPLVAAPFGNCHIHAIAIADEHLLVEHEWNQPHAYDLASVPWQDIATNRVQYALSSHYAPNERGGSPFLAGKTLPPTDAWGKLGYRLPAGHTMIDFVQEEDLLFVATRSDQGFKDGELLQPFDTVQIFVIRSLPAK